MRMLSRPLFFVFMFLLLVPAACGRADTASSPTDDPTPRIRVTVSEALVFEFPSRESEILFRLIEGDQTPILAKTEPDLIGVEWYQVGQGEEFGWIAGSQVEVSGDLSMIRTVGEAVWMPTATPATPTITPTATRVVFPDQVIATVNVAQAAVFELPSRLAEAAAPLFAGETVDVIGRVEADENGDVFYFVGRENNVIGWVLDSQVQIEGNLDIVPVLQDVDASVSALLGENVPPVGTEISVVESPSPLPPTEIAASDTPDVSGVVTFTPPPTATPRISLTPSHTPDLAVTAQNAPTATDIPATDTPTPRPTGVAALTEGEAPPLQIELLPGWQAVHVLVPLNTAFLQGDLPVSIYQGPLEGDMTGTMWIVWGFPNVTSPTGELNLYGDGVQLLRGLIFDSTTCAIGLGDEKRTFTIDGIEGTGTIYSAVDCEGSNDIAGSFTVVPVVGGSFAFIVGIEPVEKVNLGLPQLEAMLNTIVFDEGLVPEGLNR